MEHSVRFSALNSKIFLMATPFCVVISLTWKFQMLSVNAKCYVQCKCKKLSVNVKNCVKCKCKMLSLKVKV